MPLKKSLSVVSLLFFGVIADYLFPGQKLPVDKEIDKLVVLKTERGMLAYSQGKLLKTYSKSLGRNPSGDKKYEGDSRTPEGNNIINAKIPNSGYHKNLGISFPNAVDIRQAKQLGESAGGDIKIHGLRNGTGFISNFHKLMDWTQGCMAVTDEEIDELYSAVAVGTPIEIRP